MATATVTKPATQADKDKALNALLTLSSEMGVQERTITEKAFTSSVELYDNISKAAWAACTVFGAKDADTMGADSISALKVATEKAGKVWTFSDSTISRLRTMRLHTMSRMQAFQTWTLDGNDDDDRRPCDIGTYISFLGRIKRGDANEDGSLTAQGEEKKAEQVKKERKVANARLVPAESDDPNTVVFDISTFTPSSDAVNKLADALALQQTVNATVKQLTAKAGAATLKAAKAEYARRMARATMTPAQRKAADKKASK